MEQLEREARAIASEWIAEVESNVGADILIDHALDLALNHIRPYIHIPPPPRAPWWQRFLGSRNHNPSSNPKE